MPADTETLIVRPARTPADLDAFRALCREYAASLPFSLCFQGFDEEMAALPGKYAPPQGEILIAWHAGQPVGCVALRPITPLLNDPPRVCEMKRMYVSPQGRGRGIGRLLAQELLRVASAAGYGLMKLDSDRDFQAASALYRSLGFTDTPRYNDDPHESTIFLARRLPWPG